MDLSKAFDTTNDNLLLTKLLIYGFCMNAPNLMCIYVILKMENRERKLTTTLVLQNLLLLGVRQGSIDESISFNLLINDLVLFLTETMWSDYADDNNLFSIEKD